LRPPIQNQIILILMLLLFVVSSSVVDSHAGSGEVSNDSPAAEPGTVSPLIPLMMLKQQQQNNQHHSLPKVCTSMDL